MLVVGAGFGFGLLAGGLFSTTCGAEAGSSTGILTLGLRFLELPLELPLDLGRGVEREATLPEPGVGTLL